MARLVSSTVEPDTLQPDIVQNGRVRILVHWGAVKNEIDEDGEEVRIEWEYQEQVIWIPLPNPAYIDTTGLKPTLTETGFDYLAENEWEILAWAQAGVTESTEAPGLHRRTQELEDAIVEMSMLLAGGGM